MKGGVFLSKKDNNEQNLQEHIKYIYTASITLRNGKKIYARSYGKKAFRIPVNS